MAATIITPEDLQAFKLELLEDLRKLIAERKTAPAQQWYKSHEIRKLLGISQGTLQHLRTTGTLPFTKIGGVILYDYQDIQKMIQDHKHTRDFVFENPKSL
ncbi:MAG: DNA-binding protein [Azospira oryzae]|jgi:3-methyladenine DNA glycosylase Tag|nr:MAG: DNA-binding protein [Azospira oryzae]